MDNQKNKEENNKNDPAELDIFQVINILFVKISSIESQLNYIKSDIKFLKRLIIVFVIILSIILSRVLA
jgi:hypothetical protein